MPKHYRLCVQTAPRGSVPQLDSSQVAQLLHVNDLQLAGLLP